MHSKKKGNIGQFATAVWLAKNDFSVFTEEGDISAIDLIAEKNGKLIKFQCKAITPKNNCLILPLKKSGPNGYNKVYQEESFNYFAAYDLQNEQLYFVSSEILQTNNNAINLRLEKPKNNQCSGIRLAEDYLADNCLSLIVQ